MSETIFIGYDKSNDTDYAVLSICRTDDKYFSILKTYHGEEANKIYKEIQATGLWEGKKVEI